MARVVVLAEKAHDVLEAHPPAIFRAQVYSGGDDARPVWTCTHRHATAAEAQRCGIEHSTVQQFEVDEGRLGNED